MSPPTSTHPPTPAQASSSPSSSSTPSSSSSSFSSLSLAFSQLITKRSPRLQASDDPIQCSSANNGAFILQPKRYSGPFNGLFADEEVNNPGKEEEKKIKAISQRLLRQRITSFKETDIAYVLNAEYANRDTGKAFELLVLLEDSEEGIIQNYDPGVKLLGAINREGVTCYLDALLFAMFARLGSFEAMLYKNFEDPPRKRLATLLRLWVNMLRAGKLITTEITKQIQLQMASCGWKEAAEFQRQQDASEAFTFITSTLALPLLTLKMDIFHTGREDASDDHKFINERLLELAVPEEPSDGHTITLEECLELFFNNKIEVKRYLDSVERRNTLNSIRSHQSFDSTKVHASHVEIAEIDHSRPPSPSLHPAHTAPIQVAPVKPSIQRRRAPSIIQEHYIDEKSSMLGHSPSIAEEQRGRTGRVRKEVIMPAWQFFSLIPWYTNSMPSNDAQVAAHFSSTRPILGICLKRYSMLPNGTAIKRKTRIDIPLEIGLPHFIQDDKMTEDGPAFGNFKLSLQSVVCHQGLSVESGHYISLVRSPDPREQGEDMWMRFDDLAEERVTHINIEDFLRQESPYLLFYQVIPIEGEPGDIAEGETPTLGSGKPPAYSQSTVSQDSKVDSGISGFSLGKPSSGRASNEIQRHSLEVPRPSIDSSTSDGGPQGRSSIISERPQSAVFPDNSASSVGVDLLPDPKVDNKASDISGTFTASRRDSRLIKASSSKRPNSRVDDKRISTSLSRLANRMSGDKLNAQPAAASKQMEEICPHPTVPGGTEVKPTAPLIKSSDKPVDRAKIKKEAKEKSKASHRAYQNLNKGRRKDGKPDRECSIM